jgi:hypothetical protein
MEKKYKVWISVRKYDGTMYSVPIYTDKLRGFRTEKGAIAFLKRIVEKFKR